MAKERQGRIDMEGILVGLSSLVVALSVQRIFLEKYGSRLRSKEQAFQFHALRDDLQLLVAEGSLSTSSLTCDFLMRMLNFAIRNAGVIRLREIVDLSERIRRGAANTPFSAIDADIRKHDARVQELAQRFFETFAVMLVSNDWLVWSGVRVLNTVRTSWTAARPLVRAINRIMTTILSLVSPVRLRAVRDARWYSERASGFKTCAQF